MNLNDIIKWLNSIKEQHQKDEALKLVQSVATGFTELHNLAITYHGRLKLYKIITAYDNGELELDPGVAYMYRYMLLSAPYQLYANLN